MAIFFRATPSFALLCSLLFPPTTSAQSRPPVILVGGGNQDCTKSSFSSRTSFGSLETMLARKLIRTEFFELCSVPSKAGGGLTPIEEMGEALGALIDQLANPEVDLVAYSLGGVVVRCYLSGKQTKPGVFKPPMRHKVRKLVFLGVGHFGGFLGGLSSPPEVQALEYGSRFFWDLANWDQGREVYRQVDAVELLAFSGAPTDGAVSLISGSLSFAYPAERTRIIRGCHDRSMCSPGVAYVDSVRHPAWLVVDSFLDGTDDWKTVGQAPDEDSVLSRMGGLMVGVKDAWDKLIQDSQVSISGRAVWKGAAGDSVGTFVEELIETGKYTLQASAPFPAPDRTVTVAPGIFTVVTMKPGPLVEGIQSAGSASRSPSIAAGAIISIHGERLADAPIEAKEPFPGILGSTTVSLNDRPIPLLYVSESQIDAQLPDDVTGFARLTVTNDKGAHGLNLFLVEKEPLP